MSYVLCNLLTKATRDPGASARRSQAALEKDKNRVLDDGTPAHGFSASLMAAMVCTHFSCHSREGGNP
jgi:hypothetical protein